MDGPAFSCVQQNMTFEPTQLYRFSKAIYLDDTLARGKFRFAHARTFSNSELASGQRDDEQRRRFSPEATKHRIAMSQPDRPIVLSGVYDINITLNLTGRTGRPLDYYILCFSRIYDKRFYSEFSADACIFIKDASRLFQRIEDACRKVYPNCDLFGGDCNYYNHLSLPSTNKPRELCLAKHDVYAWQKEYRIVFAIDPDMSQADSVIIELGSIEDIAERCED